MAASVQTVKKFSLETGISITKVKELIRQGVIPEVPRENDTCMQLVNKVLFDELLESNLIVIPLSERSIKRIEKTAGEDDECEEEQELVFTGEDSRQKEVI